MRNYHAITDDFLRSNPAPICPHCRRPMAPADDHGRFICFCQGIGEGIRNNTFNAVSGTMMPPPPEIFQVDTTGMTDEQKAKIPPIHRLHSTPTATEAEFLAIAAKGPDAMDDPAYWAASRRVDEERQPRRREK